jgi:AraC-like DNA-binding protein
MLGQAHTPSSYDEIDSDALPAARCFALWRETVLLPLTVEPDDDARRRFDNEDEAKMPASTPRRSFSSAAISLLRASARRRLRCSRAHLYRVFAGRGETVAGYVRERRQLRARALLTGPPERNIRIGDIAYCCGFEDPVHFARLFRERFGLPPRELRADGPMPRHGPSTGGDPRVPAT